ncbi:MAG: hypothetical protein ACYC61_22405 [Isosphaeraceae bacterium]
MRADPAGWHAAPDRINLWWASRPHSPIRARRRCGFGDPIPELASSQAP